MIEEKIINKPITVYSINGVEFNTREKAEEYESVLLLLENFKGWDWNKKPFDLTLYKDKDALIRCIEEDVYFFTIKNKKAKELLWDETSLNASLNRNSDEEEKWFWHTFDEEWRLVEEAIRKYEEKIVSLKEVFGE